MKQRNIVKPDIIRRVLKGNERKVVYSKCNGHCAYCGCELAFKDMQVDHVVSLYGHNGADDISNMLPACRSCNHRKGTSTLEQFRKAVERFPEVLMRDSVTYKNAVRFGLVEPKPHKIKFYFETLSEGENGN